jgi:hypothetical protein
VDANGVLVAVLFVVLDGEVVKPTVMVGVMLMVSEVWVGTDDIDEVVLEPPPGT